MWSLRQLLTTHASLLLIDSASTRIQVGYFAGDAPARWAVSDEESCTGIFVGVERLNLDLNEIGAFAFCDGPGSVLGIRTAAMALRTWNVLRTRPLFSYCSLALAAHAAGRSDVTAIADARRELWHAYRIGEPLRRVPAAALTGELIMPESFRHWSSLPAGTTVVSYALPDLWPQLSEAILFKETTSPDAFLHEEPSYVTWTPKIHRADPAQH